MLNTEQLKRYGRLYLARKKLRAKDKEMTEELAQMEEPLIEHLVNEGVEKVSLKGGIVLNIQSLIWAKIVAEDEFGRPDKKKVIEALRQAGLADLVNENFNYQRLAMYLRELARNDEQLPDVLRGIIEPNPTPKLHAKKI